ncbi:MAG: YigZ family protein [Clostridia bacterium]|nr:YigZ family protein [Clostridia bacterium]
MESFLSIKKDEIYTSEIVINKSRFLGFAKFVESGDEAESFLNELREKYKDARHICFAYKLRNSARLSDDGEPSGTAGKPILNIIEKKGLVNVVIAVVRYFGGVKLGAGGLLRAYSGSAVDTIENAKIVEWLSSKIYEVELDYKDYQPFINNIKGRKIKVIDTNFDNGATLKVVASSDELIENSTFIGDIFEYYEGE